MIRSLRELEILLESDKYVMKFMYVAPSSEEPMRHWWCPPGHEPFQDSIAEENPFPDQASIFWQLCEELQRPPTQGEFCRRFYDTYKNSGKKWAHLFDDQWTKWGAEARVRRTYPSFVREYHLDWLLKHVFGETAVDRHACLDHQGVDFLVRVDKEWFPVRTYVQTKRSKEFAKDKSENRHKGLEGAVDLILSLQKGREVGMFKVYHIDQVRELREILRERIRTAEQEDSGALDQPPNEEDAR